MEQFIGCDAHKKFSLFASINEKGEYGLTFRVGHAREEFRSRFQLPEEVHRLSVRKVRLSYARSPSPLTIIGN